MNGTPVEKWRMAVTYEPDDTYSVWLWGFPDHPDHSGPAQLFECANDVYSDNLQEVVENMYGVR